MCIELIQNIVEEAHKGEEWALDWLHQHAPAVYVGVMERRRQSTTLEEMFLTPPRITPEEVAKEDPFTSTLVDA